MSENAFARAVQVLTSPTKAFAALASKPAWVVPILLLAIFGCLANFAMSGKVDMEEIILASLEQSGQEVPEAQLEGIIGFYEKFGVVMGYLTYLLFVPLLALLVCLISWVVIKFVGGDLSFGQAWSVSSHALMPKVVALALALPAAFSRTEFSYDDIKTGSILPSNLGYLAPEDASNQLLAVLSSFDVFGLWSLFLAILGYSIVGKVKPGTAALALGALWVVTLLIKVAWSSLSGG